MKILVVVDMQNDFIDAALGTKEAQAIVENVRKKIEGFDGKKIFTRDTHKPDYLNTLEGKNLPVKHCIEGSEGWQISSALPVSDDDKIIDKPTFGSKDLALYLEELAKDNTIDEIEVIGLCTDICVITFRTVNVKKIYMFSLLGNDCQRNSPSVQESQGHGAGKTVPVILRDPCQICPIRIFPLHTIRSDDLHNWCLLWLQKNILVPAPGNARKAVRSAAGSNSRGKGPVSFEKRAPASAKALFLYRCTKWSRIIPHRHPWPF